VDCDAEEISIRVWPGNLSRRRDHFRDFFCRMASAIIIKSSNRMKWFWRGSKGRLFLLRRRKIRTRLNKQAYLDVYWQLMVGSVSESLINSRKGLPAVLVCRGAQHDVSKTMTRHWDELREQLESRLDSEGHIRASTVIWLQCEEIWQDDEAHYHDSYLSYGTVWFSVSVRH